jgi:hypothetical protein
MIEGDGKDRNQFRINWIDYSWIKKVDKEIAGKKKSIKIHEVTLAHYQNKRQRLYYKQEYYKQNIVIVIVLR